MRQDTAAGGTGRRFRAKVRSPERQPRTRPANAPEARSEEPDVRNRLDLSREGRARARARGGRAAQAPRVPGIRLHRGRLPPRRRFREAAEEGGCPEPRRPRPRHRPRVGPAVHRAGSLGDLRRRDGRECPASPREMPRGARRRPQRKHLQHGHAPAAPHLPRPRRRLRERRRGADAPRGGRLRREPVQAGRRSLRDPRRAPGCRTRDRGPGRRAPPRRRRPQGRRRGPGLLRRRLRRSSRDGRGGGEVRVVPLRGSRARTTRESSSSSRAT